MKSAMTSSPLRVAIIGAGQVADKVHASYYCTRNDLELVAVCDSRLSQAQALAEKYGNASVWDDPQAMLLAVKPDVVSVCSPNRFHYEHTLMALEAGCHVMCEKPPAMTPGQAREMCDTARKLGKVLAYDFHHRFALDTQQLREQVTNGVLGEIYVTTARALRRCGVPGWGVFTNKELQGGGPLIDIGIHMLDAAMYVLGFPAVKSVNAHSFQKIGTQKSCGQFGECFVNLRAKEDADDSRRSLVSAQTMGIGGRSDRCFQQAIMAIYRLQDIHKESHKLQVVVWILARSK